MKIQERQKRFADEYIKTGNIEQSAINAGYSKNYARARSHELLSNVGIKAYIEGRMKEINSNRIADQQEVLETISRIIRGEERGTALVGIGKGAQIVEDVPPTVAEKLKAAETMGKLYSLWTDKHEVEVTGAVTFVDDIGDGDET